MERSKHFELTKTLNAFFKDNNMTVEDIYRGNIATGYYKAISITHMGDGFYLNVNVRSGKVGQFPFNIPTSINVFRDSDVTSWSDLETMILKAFREGLELRKFFWSLQLKADPLTLNSLTLRTSSVLLPINENGFPVEQINNAAVLELYAYLLAPEQTVYGPITDQRALDVFTDGLIVPDSSGSIRNVRGRLFSPDKPYLAVVDLPEALSMYPDPEMHQHFISSLVLIDRIVRPNR